MSYDTGAPAAAAAGSGLLLPGNVSGPRLIGGSTIQYVPAKTAAAAATAKKSILIKAPPATSKLIVSSPHPPSSPHLNPDLSRPSPPAAAKKPAKLHPGIIRMASPKTAAPPSPAVAPMSVMTSAGTTVTKVDIGTAVTPGVKAMPEFPSAAAEGQQHYSTAVGVSVNGVQISRRLQLPDDESAALTKEPALFSAAVAAAVEEMETADVLLECREVFDDSFEKSGDEEMEEATNKTKTTEADEKKAAKDSGEIPAASQLAVQACAGSVSQPAAASLEPLDLLKPLPEPAVPDGRGPPLAVRTNEFGLVEVVTAGLAAHPAVAVNPRVGV